MAKTPKRLLLIAIAGLTIAAILGVVARTFHMAGISADGGDALSHLATLRDQDKLLATVASDATAWRAVARLLAVSADSPRKG